VGVFIICNKMHKFYKVIIGPVHFKTRFLPFLKYHPNTLDQYVFFVTHYELYEPYKDIAEIVDLDELRKNDTWSVENEKLLPEIDYNEYIHKTVTTRSYLMPTHLHRFVFLWFKEKGYKKFTYLANNFYNTDNLETVQRFVGKIQDKTFYIHKNHLNTLLQGVPMYPECMEKLKKEFPNLNIVNEYWWHEWKGQIFSFENLEDIQLFFELWDKIAHLGGEYRLHNNFTHGYLKIDGITGFIFRLFDLNKGYTTKHFPYELDLRFGRHLSSRFDQYYFEAGVDTWGIRSYREGDTLEGWLEEHKEETDNYLKNHAANLEIIYDGLLPTLRYVY